MRVGQRRRMHPSRYETGYVGHVHHEESANLVGYLPKPGKIDGPGIRRVAGHNYLGLVLQSQTLHLVVVDVLRLPVHPVGREVVELAGEVYRTAVGEMSSLVQSHTQNRVSRLQDGEVGCHVRLRPAVWLHVDILRSEDGLGPVDGQLLGDVHELTAAVVAATWVAFGVFVGQYGTLGLQNRLAGVVLRGDEDNVPPLPLRLLLNCQGYIRVLLLQCAHWASLKLLYKASNGGRATYRTTVALPGTPHCQTETGKKPILFARLSLENALLPVNFSAHLLRRCNPSSTL